MNASAALLPSFIQEEPRPPSPPRHHIYEQYFTPAERRMLQAIPENDLTNEIRLLRVLLSRSFAQLLRSPADKNYLPQPFDFMVEVCATFNRVVLVIADLVSLHRKLYNSAGAVGDLILEAIRELNPDEDLE